MTTTTQVTNAIKAITIASGHPTEPQRVELTKQLPDSPVDRGCYVVAGEFEIAVHVTSSDRKTLKMLTRSVAGVLGELAQKPPRFEANHATFRIPGPKQKDATDAIVDA